MIKWHLSQECKDFPISTNQSVWIILIHYINKLKNKNHMIMSIVSEKTLDKIQHPFMIKTLQKVGIEGTYLNMIKIIYERPTANIMLNDEKPKVFPWRSGTKTRMTTLSTFNEHSFGSPSHGNQRIKINKKNPNWTRGIKTVTACRWLDIIWRKYSRCYQKTTRALRCIQ